MDCFYYSSISQQQAASVVFRDKKTTRPACRGETQAGQRCVQDRYRIMTVHLMQINGDYKSVSYWLNRFIQMRGARVKVGS